MFTFADYFARGHLDSLQLYVISRAYLLVYATKPDNLTLLHRLINEATGLIIDTS